MENNRTYHIIGAGIAGLYTAKLLKEQDPLSSIIVYEAAEKIGGRCGSFFDSDLNCPCDNATHVILSCNKRAKKLLGSKLFTHKIRFWNFNKNSFIPSFLCLPEINSAVFNTRQPNWRSFLFVFFRLFPFFNLRAYFSTGDLEESLCAPLLSYVDDIHYNCVWQSFKADDNHISQLIFSHKTISVAPQDIIVSAIDSYHYNHIMGGFDFDYNSICNIIFRTSMTLTLPENLKMIGLKNATSHWLFCSSNYTAVTISHLNDSVDSHSLWNEICQIRHYNAAFLPAYKIMTYPLATISQNKHNNQIRPISCRTVYDNLFICGDWTMKNQPCCIETALNSAVRLAKIVFKN